MENWQIQKAKNRFSELLRKAQEKGPQTITRHGKAEAVLLSMKDYRKLMRKQESLTEFFQRSPLKGVGLDLNRGKDRGREVEL
ncbi:type II toxin-antitoxin system prevent-host-death family antitoxin [Prosthecochloris sp. GSB1]|uniref:type II toxin-antitoxin system Phd/YefM family antitoxin n=1 Tax=Prosthecochloris sp. GSB1 TaxID=281093 RepID=UPI000B8CA975|nr:type II toxin-antitoxin system Phd/YefM family antitoxin [Prosthecochloris sp. GSB1]ASQ90740.1 type II toxin-antitoxin system prevent-host-death family antitoxin [Prosthecochloris sp. GSB1]